MFCKKNKAKEIYDNRHDFSQDFHYSEELEELVKDDSEELVNIIEHCLETQYCYL